MNKTRVQILAVTPAEVLLIVPDWDTVRTVVRPVSIVPRECRYAGVFSARVNTDAERAAELRFEEWEECLGPGTSWHERPERLDLRSQRLHLHR